MFISSIPIRLYAIITNMYEMKKTFVAYKVTFKRETVELVFAWLEFKRKTKLFSFFIVPFI